MSAIDRRTPLMVDNMVHNGVLGALACGIIVFDRSLEAIVKMFVDGAGKDIDCMACLVAEAREEREP